MGRTQTKPTGQTSTATQPTSPDDQPDDLSKKSKRALASAAPVEQGPAHEPDAQPPVENSTRGRPARRWSKKRRPLWPTPLEQEPGTRTGRPAERARRLKKAPARK